MKRSYLDYAMSVIVSRAIPDVRDGLKPVHRRILYGMKESGYDYNRPFRKSARITGEVMGKYHPHGNQAIYDAMVRMAQDFSMRLMLVDGQGNFGSMDGDPPAAERYTEARLSKAAHSLLDDIDKDTVDFQPNYDESESEPVVLPARFPNLLVNGAGGIAVGMATNIPPHNLGEVIDACCAYIDNPEIAFEELLTHVKGPDFPTGGQIMGVSGLRSAFATGRGSVVIRAKAHFEEVRSGRNAIIVTEIPYQVNKSRMLERIAEIVNDKTVEGISDLRDESDRHGLRVVIELKRDAVQEVVLNQLYRFTQLQTSFGVNMLALNGGKPQQMGLKDIIAAFVTFREEVIDRRTKYLLARARERAHVLVGLAVAVANLDTIIKLIREASDPAEARAGLVNRAWPAEIIRPMIELVADPGRGIDADGNYRMSEEQAKAILELRLHRLTGLERDKIGDDLKTLVAKIQNYLEILASRDLLYGILRDELIEMKEAFADERRTEIIEGEFEHDIEDLIQREDMIVTVTRGGYIKRVPLSTYRAQRRGGKGRSGMTMKDEDLVTNVFVLNTHTPVLFFSSRGMVYTLKVYKLPVGTPQARGKALINLLPLDKDETITTLMPLPEDEASWDSLGVVFATAFGNIRRNKLSDFTNIKANGKIAMKLLEGDSLIGVAACDDRDDVFLATANGKSIRFSVTDVRVFSGRTSVGVRGIRLGTIKNGGAAKKGVAADEVISLSILRHVDAETEERDGYLKRRRAEGSQDAQTARSALSDERYGELGPQEQLILTVTADGYGKRSSAFEYRVTGRGGQGITNIDLGRDANQVVASFPIEAGSDLVLITDGGQTIRTRVDDIRIVGRSTRGVIVFRVAEGEKVVSVTPFADDEDDDEGTTEGPADIDGEIVTPVSEVVPDTEVAPDGENDNSEQGPSDA